MNRKQRIEKAVKDEIAKFRRRSKTDKQAMAGNEWLYEDNHHVSSDTRDPLGDGLSVAQKNSVDDVAHAGFDSSNTADPTPNVPAPSIPPIRLIAHSFLGRMSFLLVLGLFFYVIGQAFPNVAGWFLGLNELLKILLIGFIVFYAGKAWERFTALDCPLCGQRTVISDSTSRLHVDHSCLNCSMIFKL